MITIQKYVEEFKQGVIDLILGIQQREFGIPITIENQPDLLGIEGFYQQGRGNFWVATADGLVIGTIALLDIGNSQGALRKMFVSEAYRGKEHGVGQFLLETLFGWSRENLFSNIYLGTTAKFLAAQRFYEKNGFQEIDKKSLPASFPIMSVDVKFYLYNVGDSN